MSLKEQQNLLARMYTDRRAMDDFVAEPETVGRDHGLSEGEIDDLRSLTESEAAVFAESLVWKRFHEVEELLPLTRNALGSEFRSIFFEFAPTFNPRSIKKHYEDAVAFCRYLEGLDVRSSIMNAVVFEKTRLQFLNEMQFIAFCRLRRDQDEKSKVKTGRIGIAVWVRIAGKSFHFGL